jgi:hypothetical protein
MGGSWKVRTSISSDHRSSREMVEAMMRLLSKDDVISSELVRADDRTIHPTHLVQATAPGESRGHRVI